MKRSILALLTSFALGGLSLAEHKATTVVQIHPSKLALSKGKHGVDLIPKDYLERELESITAP